ncbi:hypothetical protein [Sphingobacterium hungaricum]
MSKTRLFAFLFCLCSCSSTSSLDAVKLPITENKVGIGLLHLNVSETIRLYTTDTASNPYDSISFRRIESGSNKGKLDFKTTRLGNRLKPYILSEGDSDADGEDHRNMGLIHFVPELTFSVIEQTAAGFTILINEETFETSFISIDPENDLRKNNNSDELFFNPNFIDSKISSWFYYESWEQAIKRAWYIDYEDEKLFDQPFGTNLKTDVDLHQADSVAGNWIRVIDPHKRGQKNAPHGWVQWRDTDKILVHIVLNGGYE